MLLCSGLHIWREHGPVGHIDPQELDEAKEGERKGYGEIYRAIEYPELEGSLNSWSCTGQL